MKPILILWSILIFATCPLFAAGPLLDRTEVFQPGFNATSHYRIPGVVLTPKGNVLAYCDARSNDSKDWGKIKIHLRRSFGGGETCSPLRTPTIPYAPSRFFIGEDPLAGGKAKQRHELTAFLPKDGGEIWSGGIALDERVGCSYPNAQQAADDLSVFQHLVRTESWTENWPDDSGGFEDREVTAEIWTAAMQASLDETGSLHIPARDKPYYLDGPLVLKSGQRLTADSEAEIWLKPGSNTCMVRNANLVGFKDGSVPAETKPDTDIHIEGGIWTTLATAKNELNGNARGHSSRQNWAFGTHGVILLQNARRISVKNITVRKSKPFAIHLGNVHDFEIDGLTLEDHYRDGVHVNGPASQGVIRNIRGVSHDDPVALNAWEWENYAPSYGPIRDVFVENVTGTTSGTSSIRLLPGVKRFDDGTELDCPLENITLRHITDIHEFKLYDQPNLELGRDKDFSIGVGSIRNLRFEDLVFNRPGKIELHANTDGLVIQNVLINHPITEDWHLLAIGPKSQTYKGGGSDNPARWTEIFSPDLDCTVRNVAVSGVRPRDSETDLPIDRVVKVLKLQLNPDYPKSTPKGGTGKGIWIR